MRDQDLSYGFSFTNNGTTMNPFNSFGDYYQIGTPSPVVTAAASAATNNNNNPLVHPHPAEIGAPPAPRSDSSLFKRMLWDHYSSSLHFFGGSLFPNTTTATTSFYNNYESSSTSSSSNSNTNDETSRGSDCLSRTLHSSNKTPWPGSYSSPRPTDQLLKLIRRRRGAGGTVASRTQSSTTTTTTVTNNTTYVHNNGNLNNDDSWNAVRYHIVARPADCRYVCYSSNRSTPLHAACLYRAPHDVLCMLLAAWPAATLQQDAEGWTPLHVYILYNNHTTNSCTTTALIRTGGAEAAAQHSKFVGSALHLACRHMVSLSVLAELLQVCPAQVKIPNETGCLPANLLWKAALKEKKRNHRRIRQQTSQGGDAQERQQQHAHLEREFCLDLMIRLNLLVAAHQNTPILLEQAQQLQNPLFSLHDIIKFHYECAHQGDFVGLFLQLYPFTVRERKQRKLPLHIVASYIVEVNMADEENPLETEMNTMAAGTRSLSSITPHQHRLEWPPTMQSNRISDTGGATRNNGVAGSSNGNTGSQSSLSSTSGSTNGNDNYDVSNSRSRETLDTVLEAHPEAAYVEQHTTNQRLPLHIALAEGRRTWRTGVASLVAAAPETVERRDQSTQLFPFQLAAIDIHENHHHSNKRDDYQSLTRLETIYNLLLACPHVINVQQDSHQQRPQQPHFRRFLKKRSMSE